MQEIKSALEKIAIQIADEVKFTDLGYTQNQNKTGDTQLKLDVKSDMIITEILGAIPAVKALVSEEKDEILDCGSGNLVIAYDPLDGSSLVDVNLSVGSIFGVYENEISPRNLKMSAYIVYGPRLEMVICEDEARLYRLNREGKFDFIKVLNLGEKGKLNATGATQKGWSETHRKLVKSLFDEGYRLRYSGAMVADLHQILLKGGGLFSYPATTDAPNAKLRVTFEVLPFAFIYERAGGATTDGKSETLFDLKIEKIHQTTPCFFGSKYEISRVREFYKEI